MLQSGYLPGAAVPQPMLARAAKSLAGYPENFVGNLIMPDTRVESFQFVAPIHGDEGLEAVDDDTVGRQSDYLQILMSEGQYEASVGSHARKATIGQIDMMRAREAQRNAQANGGGGGGLGPVFDLQARFTTTLLQQNMRHNEVLVLSLVTSPANYSATHVFPTLNVRTSAVVRETIIEASNTIEDDTGQPANTVVFGVGARRGAEQNANMLNLLPEDAVRVLTRDTLRTILSLPDTGQVAFATARVKDTANGASRPIMDNFIWVGRVVAAEDGVNATFGRNYWRPDDRNNQRLYVNRYVWGVQENVDIGIINHYRPAITGKNYGVLIPTTSV